MTKLTASVGVKLGPLMFLTALRHFLDKRVTENSKARDELLYDEAFIIVKAFLEAASRHTIEELQEFSNTQIPASPLIHNVRLLVPLSSCNQAATYLIKALGGEEQTTKVTGGTRWWQVRGLKGIDATWIVAKRDWQTAEKERKRRKESVGEKTPRENADAEHEGEYSAEMDPMRCMYYIHGGGYFFGSVDQERYCMQRYARKMNGRVFAINYRLAPQYPFPCAIQDALAGYLYLIQPPPEAQHTAVNPAQIILCGDSAGGGTVLALLQVIRDSGLPLPAGAVLVSPWGDLTHSFPSVFQNTASDIIPSHGLSLYRPSTLWPPPPEEMDNEVRRKLTNRLRAAVKRAHIVSNAFSVPSAASAPEPSASEDSDALAPTTTRTSLGDTVLRSKETDNLTRRDAKKQLAPTINKLDPSASAPAPPKDTAEQAHTELPARRGQPLTLEVDGQKVEIKSQVQLYAMNHQLGHPLVSPVMAYLGGLPPLFVMASDKEVLRDEVIYIAHKAAHPERYPIKESTRELYPALKGIEGRYGPTNVHLQVYDETCHVLPLFSFTTPAKFCYRAIAQFCKYVAKIDHEPESVESSPVFPDIHNVESPKNELESFTPEPPPSAFTTRDGSTLAVPPSATTSEFAVNTVKTSSSIPRRIRSFTSIFRRGSIGDVADERPPPTPLSPVSLDGQVGLRFDGRETKSGPGIAGNSSVYIDVEGAKSRFDDHMIRERVSTRGVLRPLEPEADLPACTMPLEKIGVINEAGAKRYLEGQALWDKKYHREVKKVAQHREKNLKLAKKDTVKAMNNLHERLVKDKQSSAASPTSDSQDSPSRRESESADVSFNSPLWSWTWALEGENPPPSSIVARRDTDEARRLSKSADIQLGENESRMSGNNLWALVVDFLSATPEHSGAATGSTADEDDRSDVDSVEQKRPTIAKSRFRAGRGLFGRFSNHKEDSETTSP